MCIRDRGIGGGSVPGSTILGSERMLKRYLCGFESGMVVSNEPGFYKAGAFGFRIESDLVTVPAETEFKFGSREWLKFEYLSMVPISKELIQPGMLSKAEVAWLDAFHQDVWDKLSPLLGDETAKDWLLAATSPLE
eukprot:TRINITY_DN14984_c0_g1_i5.p1 TRINITY_DN14984_c0_g1~~TRINITY_DN14984_c0_g1_i5.p1  ORF type:complete len:136 (-),score=40.71 TRINITY_DN14984_c0_g1_i5:329-736(-)